MSKGRVVYVLAVAVLVALRAAQAAVPERSHPLRFVIVADNAALSPDYGQASYVTGLAKANGFNTLRVDLVWRPDPGSDSRGFLTDGRELAALCNAAAAAVGSGLANLMVAIRPGSVNWPEDEDGRGALSAYARTVLRRLVGAGAAVGGEKGCVAGKPLHVLLELGFEVNLTTFCRPQSDTDHRQCAADYIRTAAASYAPLKADAAAYGTRITIVGCGLASHHTPFGFDLAVAAAIRRYGLRGPFWDVCDFHPYPPLGSTDPLAGFDLYPQLSASLRSTYGRLFPLVYGELALETNDTPAAKGYLGSSPYGALLLPEDRQAAAWAQAIQTARRQDGVVGLGYFLLIDECQLTGGFQSGIYYCDLTPSAADPAAPKSSEPAFHRATARAARV